MAGNDRLSVVHVDTAKDWRGGQAQVEALVRGLARRGHDVTLVTPPGSRLAERLRHTPVRIVADTSRGDLDIRAGRRLRRLADERGARLIHAHSARAHAMAWWASMPANSRPVVVSRRVDFEIGRHLFSRMKYLRPAFHYLAISSAVRDVLARGGVKPERIHLVPSGVDPGKFTYQTDRRETRHWLGIADDEFYVCNVAALTDHKDHPTLVRAAKLALAEMPNLRFLVLGEGEMRDAIEALIRELDLGGRFTLLGFRDQVEAYVAAADLFALSSHLEGLCTSILDAMLLGVPVVATRAGGIPDVVMDGETGLLAEIRRPDQLAAAIVRMARDSALRSRLAEAGARRVREHFLVDQTIELTEQAYRKILDRSHS